METNEHNAWWEDVFGQKYLDTYVDITTAEQTEAELAFLRTHLPANARVLDVCGGYGRHAIPLARSGYEVTCLDTSAHFLALAREEAAQQGVSIRTVEQDIREPFNARGTFDAAIQMFTSFGYFADAADDQRVLENVNAALNSGGVYVIDLNNAFHTIARIAQNGTVHADSHVGFERTEELSNGLVVTTVQTIDLLDQRMHLARTWQNADGGTEHYDAYFTLYTPHEMKHMLRAAGFTISGVFGDFSGAPYQFDSPRLIFMCHKA